MVGWWVSKWVGWWWVGGWVSKWVGGWVDVPLLLLMNIGGWVGRRED